MPLLCHATRYAALFFAHAVTAIVATVLHIRRWRCRLLACRTTCRRVRHYAADVYARLIRRHVAAIRAMLKIAASFYALFSPFLRCFAASRLPPPRRYYACRHTRFIPATFIIDAIAAAALLLCRLRCRRHYCLRRIDADVAAAAITRRHENNGERRRYCYRRDERVYVVLAHTMPL